MLFIRTCNVPALILSTSHCRTELSEQSFVHFIYPITLSMLSLSLPCVTTTSKPLKFGYLFIYKKKKKTKRT